MAKDYLFSFQDPETGEKTEIKISSRKGLADAALEAREEAIANETTPPAWAMSPGSCRFVREVDAPRPVKAAKPAPAPAPAEEPEEPAEEEAAEEAAAPAPAPAAKRTAPKKRAK